jgi:hypothetical protein
LFAQHTLFDPKHSFLQSGTMPRRPFFAQTKKSLSQYSLFNAWPGRNLAGNKAMNLEKDLTGWIMHFEKWPEKGAFFQQMHDMMISNVAFFKKVHSIFEKT